MNTCHIPISLGELYDKYSILLIKSEKIKDCNKLIEINKELTLLKSYIDKIELNLEFGLELNFINKLQQKIKRVNEKLWDIEDAIRKKEVKNEFDDVFIQLARLVYITNDERYRIKNEINKYLNSEINEIKSYI
jgi:hypothetical protein